MFSKPGWYDSGCIFWWYCCWGWCWKFVHGFKTSPLVHCRCSFSPPRRNFGSDGPSPPPAPGEWRKPNAPFVHNNLWQANHQNTKPSRKPTTNKVTLQSLSSSWHLLCKIKMFDVLFRCYFILKWSGFTGMSAKSLTRIIALGNDANFSSRWAIKVKAEAKI